MTPDRAAELLKRGDLVAFPTETVYGLGADAWNPGAIRKIYQVKGRPDDNPLIIHLYHPDQVSDFAADIPEQAKLLMRHFWPGPLTLVLRKRPEVPDAVTGGLQTVALRIPRHPAALELIHRAGPLAAPSANLSGRPSPTRAEHVYQDLGYDFPVLEGDNDVEVGLESTVLDLTRVPPVLLRPGFYSRKQLQEFLDSEIEIENSSTSRPSSPGVKYTHYKPKAAVRWFGATETADRQNTLLISHTERPGGYPHHHHFNGDFDRLARELYDLFRAADRQGLPSIAVEPLPGDDIHPLIAALKNRIGKAAGK